jgi:hypothetical protein
MCGYLFTLISTVLSVYITSPPTLAALLAVGSALPQVEAFVGCDSFAGSCSLTYGVPLQLDAQLPRLGSLYFKTTVRVTPDT